MTSSVKYTVVRKLFVAPVGFPLFVGNMDAIISIIIP